MGGSIMVPPPSAPSRAAAPPPPSFAVPSYGSPPPMNRQPSYDEPPPPPPSAPSRAPPGPAPPARGPAPPNNRQGSIILPPGTSNGATGSSAAARALERSSINVPTGRPRQNSANIGVGGSLVNGVLGVAQKIAEYLASKGPKVVEIFKAPANEQHVKTLEGRINSPDALFLNWAEYDIHAVAKVLKNILKNNEPLFTFDRYETLTRVQEDEVGDQRLNSIISVIQSLPPMNQTVLHCIFHMLSAIEQNQATTQMSISTLAYTFGPSLLRPRVENMQTMTRGMKLSNALVEVIMNNVFRIFGDNPMSSNAAKMASQAPFPEHAPAPPPGPPREAWG